MMAVFHQVQFSSLYVCVHGSQECLECPLHPPALTEGELWHSGTLSLWHPLCKLTPMMAGLSPGQLVNMSGLIMRQYFGQLSLEFVLWLLELNMTVAMKE